MIRYTADHEWLDDSGDDVAVGITAHATEELGDIVFIELPEVGAELTTGDEAAVIESTKAASGIAAPFDGVVTAVNDELAESPEKVNEDPTGSWFFRIRPADPGALDSLLDEAAYQALIG
ncbi:glycine cleavage system protein GcvH [Tessaracoccus flavus]|jgi:glycine cleavage system H protein|uniref:Glycine cleavage system H protein n=2 Tax=Tessaracoccus flavus TaxID=1610493 RepID=A0A1Q2CDC8_9ACTN|nr:glycine cleavage system protein GcvH [Tessaracoccus flavus]AQP44101.1 glycine cleavage system protein H [Tessaracoccus flavus]SDY35025.1 glycine cleavage system H protein [Tessaracoccus flavus]